MHRRYKTHALSYGIFQEGRHPLAANHVTMVAPASTQALLAGC